MIAEEVRAVLGLAEMVFIPAGDPPHKARHHCTTLEHRLAMLQLAIASNPHFTLSRVELDRPGPSYSVDTLRILREQWGTNRDLYFVIGWDSLKELHNWYDPMGILAQVTHLVAVSRPGYVTGQEYTQQLEASLPGITQKLLVVPVPQMDISSTELRQRVAEQRPIKYQTPEAVEQYILEHDLYR
jgi:nicotinate-nucleotide adenylyltransferase